MLVAQIKSSGKFRHVLQLVWHLTNHMHNLWISTSMWLIHSSRCPHSHEPFPSCLGFVHPWSHVSFATISSILDSCPLRFGFALWTKHYPIAILRTPSTGCPCRWFEKLYQVINEMSPIHSSIPESVLEAHEYDFPSPCWPLSTILVVVYKYCLNPQWFTPIEH